MRLDIEDKNYISELFDRKFDEKFDQKFDQKFDEKLDRKFDWLAKHLDARFDHYVGLLREDFNHKFSVLLEITKDKPGRGEVREIAKDEAKYVVRTEMAKISKLQPVTS